MSQDWSTTPRWRRLRLEILERDGYRCQVRGARCRGEADEVDHIIPVADGGPIWEPSNLRASCSWCNTWRAQRQKSVDGWRRSKARIVLVVGPIGAGKSTYVKKLASQNDVVIDYDAISKALGPELPRGHGGERHKLVNKLRGSLLTQVRRGEVQADTVWIISCNPNAEQMFPYHEVVVVDPGREEVLRRCAEERPWTLHHVVDEWYAARKVQQQVPSGIREW